MGKVQNLFSNGSAGAISRAVDDIVISIKNAGSADIPFGAPVFLTAQGAVPFNTSSPQDFTTFLGFAVRAADKTPDTYKTGQFGADPQGAWHANDLMEVLVRGSIVVPVAAAAAKGAPLYIRKSDGKLTTSAGSEGTTVLLQNVCVRTVRDAQSQCAEVVVNKRNLM